MCLFVGIVYVWIGSKSDPEDVKVAEDIVEQGVLYDKERFSMQVGYFCSSLDDFAMPIGE